VELIHASRLRLALRLYPGFRQDGHAFIADAAGAEPLRSWSKKFQQAGRSAGADRGPGEIVGRRWRVWRRGSSIA